MTLRRSLERLLPFITAAVPGGFRIFCVGGLRDSFLPQTAWYFFFYSVHPGGLFSSWCQGVGFATILMKRMAEDERLAILLRYGGIVCGGRWGECQQSRCLSPRWPFPFHMGGKCSV